MNDDEVERRLRERLSARADSVSVNDDIDDLLERATRKSRRAVRALSAMLVVVVCAAGVGVVVAARVDRGATSKHVGTAGPGVEATNAAVPTIGAASGAGSSGGSSVAVPPPAMANPGPNRTYSSGAGVMIPGFAGDQPMAKVFTRTTGSGIVVRAYRANVAAGTYGGGPPWWTPPGWCFPNGYVQADVSNDAIAAATVGALYAEQRDGSKLGGSVQIVGQNEQSVRWVVIAQGPPNAAKIRATFPDGSTDEMAPVDGVAVLIGTGASHPETFAVKLVAFDAAGGSLGTETIGGNGPVTAFAEPAEAASCVAPTTLPPPGKEQPANVAQARQQVIDTFNAAYAKGKSVEQFAPYFDDTRGFAEIEKQLRQGPYAAQVADAQTKLDDLVFLDATTAAIQYEWSIPSSPGSGFTNRFTEAHLVNGEWKLSRVGWCNDVALAGLKCPA